jgi:hypothetical protein
LAGLLIPIARLVPIGFAVTLLDATRVLKTLAVPACFRSESIQPDGIRKAADFRTVHLGRNQASSVVFLKTAYCQARRLPSRRAVWRT